MEAKSLLITTICERMPWKTLQAVLKSVELPISKGAKFTRDKLLNLVEEKKISDDVGQQLFNLYCDYLRFGDKTVSFDTIDAADLKVLVDNFDAIELDINPDSINYPFRDADTDSILDHRHQLVDVEDVDNHIYFYFVSLKCLTEKISVDVNYLESINAGFVFPNNVFDVTARQKNEQRYYDIVSINKSSLSVEYRLDTANGLNSEDLDDSFRYLKNAFINKITSVSGLNKSNLKLESRNLFCYVTAFYHKSKYRVCELGFQVGSVTHHERMRSSNKDLRLEVFHKAGLGEVKSIDVFRIALRKNNSLEKVSYESELYLPGTIKMMNGTSTAILNHAIISNCICKKDYTQLVDSMDVCLTEYLTPETEL